MQNLVINNAHDLQTTAAIKTQERYKHFVGRMKYRAVQQILALRVNAEKARQKNKNKL